MKSVESHQTCSGSNQYQTKKIYHHSINRMSVCLSLCVSDQKPYVNFWTDKVLLYSEACSKFKGCLLIFCCRLTLPSQEKSTSFDPPTKNKCSKTKIRLEGRHIPHFLSSHRSLWGQIRY